MKIMKAKSMTAIILFLALSLSILPGIASAQITKITGNTYEDSFPQTAGGYIVWQAHIDGDWEIFLYNANNNTGPFQITDNDYDDISPKTDGNYVIWTAGSVSYGEIFIYDIATSITTQLTNNNDFEANPQIFNGLVAWISQPRVESGLAPGVIFLYDIANITTTNISALVGSDTIYNDMAFRFDGQQIFWLREDVELGSSVNYLYDLATGSISRYYTPEDEEDFVPYLEDLATGAIDQLPLGLSLTLQDNPQVDGDFMVFTSVIDGNREINVRDKKHKRGGPITANDIDDTQPSIGGYLLAWKGDRGDDAEIYTYELPSFYADAGRDLYLGPAQVPQAVIQGFVEGETDGPLQYRWFDWNGIGLSDWQPVIDGIAPLSLAYLSELDIGMYTFSLEVTNGNITVNDQMVLSVENWLKLVSPADGSTFSRKELPAFAWDSSYTQFKIQFGNVEGEFSRTYPKNNYDWLNDPSFTPDNEQTADIKDMLGKESNLLYWRVLGFDGAGNVERSKAQHIILSK
jgi:hypothetical protein